MTKANPLTGQLETLIATVILEQEERGADYIDPVYIADAVDQLIDPEGAAPALKSHAAILQIREHTRKQLAHRRDPVKQAEQYVESQTEDLFGGVLQDYYPVKREDATGSLQTTYARRDVMTPRDVTVLAQRMDKAGDSLKEHARALLAWDRSR